jgi:hypothetical protein
MNIKFHPSRIQRCVFLLKLTDVSEGRTAFIIRATSRPKPHLKNHVRFIGTGRTRYNLERSNEEGLRIGRGKREKQEVLGRTNSPTVPACHLFELLEPNLMEINLSELTLTSFNSI